MAVRDTALPQQHEDLLEKGMAQEKSDIRGEESLGSGDSGLNQSHALNKDDPLVCSIYSYLSSCSTDDSGSELESFVQNLYCRTGFPPRIYRPE